ncbi:MAG: DNA polymerase IV [Patescibacteria group bacterium]
MKRIIAHLDMDAFFAAIEERDNPRFRGMPIAVGSDPMGGQGRGVVATANYKAREYGIHSALPISKAWQFSEAARKSGKPPVVFLPPNFERYTEASEHVMDIIRAHAPLVEQASVDEAYFDVSFSGSYAKAEKLCQTIKEEIKEREKVTASVGIGPNKLIAKIASGFQKPDGLTIVREENAEAFLEPMSVRAIPGIGPKTESLFVAREARTVKDLKKFSREELTELTGKWGTELYEKIRGRDDAPVVEEYEVKSIGEQETFLKDTISAELIFERLSVMCKNIMARLAGDSFRTFKTVVITVRFTGFETKTRSHTFPDPQRTMKALQMEVFRLILPFLDARENPKGKLIRLVGVRIEKLA